MNARELFLPGRLDFFHAVEESQATVRFPYE